MVLRASSNSSSFHCSKLKPFGEKFAEEKERPMTPGSDEGEEILSDMPPCRLGASGVARAAVNSTCHSTTSNATLTPQASLRFCCRNSFIGSGSIWREPEFEIIALKESGLAGVYPASASSALPLAGSNL